MCYISVSMDVNGAVIQERVAYMRAVLLESLVESQEITSHTSKASKVKLEYDERNVKEESNNSNIVACFLLGKGSMHPFVNRETTIFLPLSLRVQLNIREKEKKKKRGGGGNNGRTQANDRFI